MITRSTVRAIAYGARLLVPAVAGLLGLTAPGNAEDPAVIFIPGITGSILELKDPPGEIAWGVKGPTERNLTKLTWPIGQDEDPRFNAPRILRVFSGGLDIKSGFIGGMKGYLDFDNELVRVYGPDRDRRKPNRYFPFPYDWRYSSLKTACVLKARLDAAGSEPFKDASLKERALRDGVVLVGHSMGGIIANLLAHFQAPAGTAESPDNPCPHQYKVPMVITIATPHLGAVTALSWMVDKPASWLMNNFTNIPVADKRRMAYSIPAMYELMPSYDGCCLKGPMGAPPPISPVEDPLSMETWERNGWLPAEVKADPAWKAHAQKYLDGAKRIRKILASPLPDSVAVVHIAGTGAKTKSKIFTGQNQFDNSTEGDDTVPLSSADPGFPYPTNVRGRSAKSDHLGLVNDLKVQRFVIKAINLVGKPLAQLEAGIKAVGAETTKVATRDGMVAAQSMVLDVASEALIPGEFTQITFYAEHEVVLPGGAAELQRIANIDPARVRVEIEPDSGARPRATVDALSNGSYSIVFRAPATPGTLSITVTLPGEGLNRSALLVVAPGP